MAAVVVSYSFDVAQPHWQLWLGTFQCLHRLFSSTHRTSALSGRLRVQTHDVADLLHKQWVGGELEALAAMRRQTEQRE
jgi:hypothetical protein